MKLALLDVKTLVDTGRLLSRFAYESHSWLHSEA